MYRNIRQNKYNVHNNQHKHRTTCVRQGLIKRGGWYESSWEGIKTKKLRTHAGWLSARFQTDTNSDVEIRFIPLCPDSWSKNNYKYAHFKSPLTSCNPLFIKKIWKFPLAIINKQPQFVNTLLATKRKKTFESAGNKLRLGFWNQQIGIIFCN